MFWHVLFIPHVYLSWAQEKEGKPHLEKALGIKQTSLAC